MKSSLDSALQNVAALEDALADYSVHNEKLISQAACMMRTVQQECEETYMDADETPLRLTDKSEE